MPRAASPAARGPCDSTSGGSAASPLRPGRRLAPSLPQAYNCAVSDPQIGSVIAGQRIDGVLGRGGMGVVYRATDLALDRAVALKVIAPSLAGDPALRRRFMSESRLAASLDHPNVIPIYRAGEEEGVLFLVMRLVDGE